MSHDIRLIDPITKRRLHSETTHHMRGGTYAIGGTTELYLNITCNYHKHYARVLGDDNGITVIYGMYGADSIPILQRACEQLGDDVHDDYWKPTEGNAKAAMLQLIALAKIRPDGIWEGD